MPLVNAININNSNGETKQKITEFSNEEFTHVVFCEIATQMAIVKILLWLFSLFRRKTGKLGMSVSFTDS